MTSLGWNSVDQASRRTPLRGERPRPAAGKKNLPGVEYLESLRLMSVGNPVISGFVFVDENGNAALTNNGLFDPGERPVPNAQVELLTPTGAVLETTKTDANGFYQFTSLPPTAPPVTTSQTVSLSQPITNFTNTPLAPSLKLFDPTLGTLAGVSVSRSVSLNGTVTTQNASPNSPTGITVAVNGSYQVNGLNQQISFSGSQTQGPVTNPPFDPNNPNANKITVALAQKDAPAATTYSSPTDLAFFTASPGRTSITPTMSATGVGSASSTGNDLNTSFVGSTAASVTVTYTYVPSVPIKAGSYILEQSPLLPNLTDGKASENGVVFPNPGSPQMLPITVTNVDLPNNDFGKLTPGTSPNNGGTCPTVSSLVRFGVHQQPTQIVLTFAGGTVDPTLANNPANYYIVSPQGQYIAIRSATFDPATNAVTLIPDRGINVHFVYDLHVILPCATSVDTTVIPFGKKTSLGGFTDHQGTFVMVQNGHIVGTQATPPTDVRALAASRAALHTHAQVAAHAHGHHR